jgi:hypothetical protein
MRADLPGATWLAVFRLPLVVLSVASMGTIASVRLRPLLPASPLRLLAAAATGALLVPTLLVGVASAGGITGEPQPDAKQFTVAAKSGSGSSVVASDGSLVAAYDVGNTIHVCRILRSARKCSSTTVLKPIDADDAFGTPQVYAPSPGTIVVLQNTCCATNPDGTLLYTSSDFGKIFGAPVRVGTLGVDVSTMVGGNIVFTQGDDHVGLEVESTPVTATGLPQASEVVESSAAAYDVGLGHVKGGVLLGVDNSLPTSWATTVRFAASGSNPGLAASYSVVGNFPNEQLIAISGNAVLTQLGDAKSTMRLRLFNGTKFTAPSSVPGGKGGGPEWFGLDVDPSGLVHVFVESSRNGYDVFQVTTRDDVKWSAERVLGDAISSTSFSAAIDKAGTGILFGTGAKATAYPILAPQSVSVALAPSSIVVGGKATVSGKASPKLPGRTVVLQYEKSGKWFAAVGATESASGKFSFPLTGLAAGATHYRAVVQGEPGHYLYGYSKSVTLTVT